MRALRTAPTHRVVAIGLAGTLAAGSATAIALAATGGSVPPAKPAAVAIHDALSAPSVPGVQAEIRFTNHIVDAAALQGSDPLLAGAHGRLWATADRRIRLELQSDRGDAQIISDGSNVSLYDPAQKTLYRAKLPARDATAAEHSGTAPSIAQISSKLTQLARHATISGAEPTNVAGRPAYTLKVSSIRHGGLLRGAELAWDAARGVPLRAALYSTANSSPVLEIKATSVSFTSVPASAFDFSPPRGTKVVDLGPRSPAASGKHEARGRAEPAPVTGMAAVARAVPFPLRAPATLAGRLRHEVRLIDHGGHPGALVTYGQGLDAVAVLEQPAATARSGQKPTRTGHRHGRDRAPTLPSVPINGATGQELDTALGSLIRFTRGGVTYTVLGSVSPAAAKAAARGL